MDSEKIRQRAYQKWKAEGRPDGAHERHWFEAKAEQSETDGSLPETWVSGGDHGVSPRFQNERQAPTTSDAIADAEGEPGSFKPGELASENK